VVCQSTNSCVKGNYLIPLISCPDWEICSNDPSVPVMRRKVDSWMNATQILKVADFDKPQRTRILEREVQKGMHEKVQGGYGKYQGFPPSLLETYGRDLGAV
jgi:hypothetical protein